MLCDKCGTKNDEGTKFCGNCGATIEPPVASNATETADNEKLNADYSIGNVAFFSAPADGPAKLEVGGKILNADPVFKGLAIALLAVLVILPFLVHGFSVVGYSTQVSRNFFQHLFGSASSLFSLFVLLTPIALFCMFQFKNNIPIDSSMRFTAVLALSGLGFIMPFIVRAQIFRPLRVASFNPFAGVRYWVNPAIGFILTLLLYIVVAIIAFGFMQAVNKNKASLTK